MSRLEVKKVQLSDKTWMDAYLDEKQDKAVTCVLQTSISGAENIKPVTRWSTIV